MGEISKEVGQWIVHNVGWSVIIVLFILSCLFKITKIEVDPLGWFISWIGKLLTKNVRADIADLKTETNTQILELKRDTSDKFDTLEAKTEAALDALKDRSNRNDEELDKRLREIELNQDHMAAARIKNHVLTFSRRCRNGEKHTKEDFMNLIEENVEYERLVQKHGWKNDVYKEDYTYFLEEYRRCIRENDFLK